MVRAGTVEVRGGTVVSWVTQPDGRIVDNLPVPSPGPARLMEKEGAVSASGAAFVIAADANDGPDQSDHTILLGALGKSPLLFPAWLR